MKVIIDIPKKEYDIIKNYKSFMPWAEGLIKKGVAIPEGATNGDIIKAMFPNAQIDYHKANELVEEYVTFYINGCDTCQDYTLEWWNAPYKGVEE